MSDKVTVLVVDDEEQMRSAMQLALERCGYEVISADNGTNALKYIETQPIQVIVSDLRMPTMSGDQLMAEVRQKYPTIPFVMITAYGTIAQAVEAMKLGAFDFLTKPFSAEDLEQIVERAIALNKPQKKTRSTRESRSDSRSLLTNDPNFVRIIEIASAIAPSNASVMIEGESGTGKELIARLIHSSSHRAEGPFVAINCAALPENLLESELFGFEKGAFTGALTSKPGKFEIANGGTILLDEISEMELPLQAKLLRVLQEREVDRVGGTRPVSIDVRVIATTNRNLNQMVKQGDFREDLYYRLNVIPLRIPPLRERHGDVKLLIEHFVRKFSAEKRKTTTPQLIEQLSRYNWPGNVRELENACERAVLLAKSDILFEKDFLIAETSSTAPEQVSDYLRLHPGLSVAEAEKRLIEETLRSTNNNRTKAADLLGISIRTLRNKLNEYGVND